MPYVIDDTGRDIMIPPGPEKTACRRRKKSGRPLQEVLIWFNKNLPAPNKPCMGRFDETKNVGFFRTFDTAGELVEQVACG